MLKGSRYERIRSRILGARKEEYDAIKKEAEAKERRRDAARRAAATRAANKAKEESNGE